MSVAVKTLRHANDLHLRSILHSRKFCADIALHLGNEMETQSEAEKCKLKSIPLNRLSTAAVNNSPLG
jgi:hypothetical protein